MWHSINTRPSYKMKPEIYLDQGPSLLVLGRVLPSRCSLSHLSRASRLLCTWNLPVSIHDRFRTDLWYRIEDRKSTTPRMRGFLHGSSLMFQERGAKAFFQGLVPTTARQAANSATRFGSYTTIKQFAQGYVAPGEKLGTVSTFGIGGLAGLITVFDSSITGYGKRSDASQIRNTTIRHH